MRVCSFCRIWVSLISLFAFGLMRRDKFYRANTPINDNPCIMRALRIGEIWIDEPGTGGRVASG